MLAPLRIFMQNSGTKNASSVNAKITIPKADGLRIIGEYDYPEKPRNPLLLRPTTLLQPRTYDTVVRETDDSWVVEVDGGTIQPQDEFWSTDNFYISVQNDQLITAQARIFADDLAKPIEMDLTINAKITTREITLADLEIED
jgi:hypothetical protein